MRNQQTVNWLDRYLESLQTENSAQSRFIEQAVPALGTLYSLVRILWAVLRPVPVAPAFRADLKQNLVAEARRRQVNQALDMQPRASRRNWWAPVAVLGTVSLVGAYAWWRRSQPAAGEDLQIAA